jgi:hypothetical protein
MFNETIRSLALSIAIVALSACATVEEKLIESGATRLNGEQAAKHITGYTERWSKGGGYYNPDGKLEVVWNGANLSGPYTISSDGNVCYEVSDWGQECHYYMDDHGSIVLIWKGKNSGVRELMKGNRLSDL